MHNVYFVKYDVTVSFLGQTYQYKSTNNLHLHLQDAADVEPFVVRKVSDHNNEQLNLREVGKLLRGKENKGELFSVHPSFNS